MRSHDRLAKLLTILSAFGMCIPWSVATSQDRAAYLSGATGAPDVPDVTGAGSAAVSAADVALTDGGTLTGQVFGSAGGPQPHTDVALIHGVDVLATATTDDQGRFRVTGLRGGTYQLVAGSSSQLVRAWAPQTAPPSAQSEVFFVLGDQVVRGQQPCNCGSPVGCSECVGPPGHAGRAYGGRPVLDWMRAHPGLVVAGIAAAIAIPVAIAASDDDDDNS